MLTIIEPQTPDHYEAVRRLCWEYRDFLLSLDEASVRIVRTVYSREKYTQVLDAVEVDHAAPKGGARLALLDGQAVGCGMFHALEPGVAEIKRVFVDETARGTGAGRAIMLALIQQCRDDGYHYIRMDTGKTMDAAARLYLSLGFELRDAYSEIPEIAQGHLLFFEMNLKSGPSGNPAKA